MQMKNKYYLSSYITQNELAHLIKSEMRTNQGIALWEVDGDNVTLLKYWELERITGMKKHNIPFYSLDDMKSFINDRLSEFNLSLDDIDEVLGTPELDSQSDNAVYKLGNNDFSIHTICHICSAILSEMRVFNNETIVALAVDGGPDGYVQNKYKGYGYCGLVSKKGKISELQPISSPGILWDMAHNVFHMQEGSLMALATASDSVCYYKGNLDLECKRLKDYYIFADFIERVKEEVYSLTDSDAGVCFSGFDERFSEEENRISMCMKIIQDASVKMMEKNIEQLLEMYDVKPEDAYLSITGGYGLNCPTNSHLMNKFGFKDYIAPPCVDDTGIALGLGLLMLYKKYPNMKFSLKNAFHGQADQFDLFLQTKKFDNYIEEISDIDYAQVTEDLIAGPIVWFYGDAEIGPRALGHRSILGDPRYLKTKDILNVLKQREWWRPIAPIILEEDIREWFENAYVSPYMLHTMKIKPEKAQFVPSILHLDNSARVQTISPDNCKVLYDVIRKFKEITGVPIICNTSLNDKGEPIINKINECFNFALRKKFKVIYVNGKRICLKNHDLFTERVPAKRNNELFNKLNDEDIKVLSKKFNPCNISRDNLNFAFQLMSLFRNIDLTDEKNALFIVKYKRIYTI
ncbi:nebramycin 5' synthase [Lachnospiraceae bacterium]|nr:nebramycin 5' synthase [Lachnospiraceae bacterium]